MQPVSVNADAVEHDQWGRGKIIAWLRGGRGALVAFDTQALPLEVSLDELRGAPDDAQTPGAPATPPVPPLDLLTIEAMRLGVVPMTRLDHYTVGRTVELALVAADLAASSTHGGAVRAFLGDYGVGKTHLLELIQQDALAQGFLTSRVVLDPEENSPAQPKRVYRSAVRHLRYPDGAEEHDVGLGPLLTQASRNPQALARFCVHPKATTRTLDEQLAEGLHLYLSPAIAYLRTLERTTAAHLPRRLTAAELPSWLGQSRRLLLDWIEGHPTLSNQHIDLELSRLPGRHPKIYSLLDFRPWAKIYGYILNGLACLARCVGYNGLVLVVDEAEFYALLSSQNRLFARSLFQAWTLAAVGHQELGLPFEEEALLPGGFGIQRRLPLQYATDAGLYVVLAMTPSSDALRVLHDAIAPHLINNLSRLEACDYLDLTQRVFALYANAHPGEKLTSAMVEPLANIITHLVDCGLVTNPRQAMKFLIEFLDLVRHLPGQIPQVLRELQQTFTL